MLSSLTLHRIDIVTHSLLVKSNTEHKLPVCQHSPQAVTENQPGLKTAVLSVQQFPFPMYSKLTMQDTTRTLLQNQ